MRIHVEIADKECGVGIIPGWSPLWSRASRSASISRSSARARSCHELTSSPSREAPALPSEPAAGRADGVLPDAGDLRVATHASRSAYHEGWARSAICGWRRLRRPNFVSVPKCMPSPRVTPRARTGAARGADRRLSWPSRPYAQRRRGQHASRLAPLRGDSEAQPILARCIRKGGYAPMVLLPIAAARNDTSPGRPLSSRTKILTSLISSVQSESFSTSETMSKHL